MNPVRHLQILAYNNVFYAIKPYSHKEEIHKLTYFLNPHHNPSVQIFYIKNYI